MASTAGLPATDTASSAHQIKCVGAGAYWTSTLVTSAPTASPRLEKRTRHQRRPLAARWLQLDQRRPGRPAGQPRRDALQ